MTSKKISLEGAGYIRILKSETLVNSVANGVCQTQRLTFQKNPSSECKRYWSTVQGNLQYQYNLPSIILYRTTRLPGTVGIDKGVTIVRTEPGFMNR
jgi:hypothetical protein